MIAAIDWISIALVITGWALALVLVATWPQPGLPPLPGHARRQLKRQGLLWLTGLLLVSALALLGGVA